MIGRIKDAGGQAEMLAPPDRGIRGNSHMIMQDKNNLQIADLILQWIDARVSKRKWRKEMTRHAAGTLNSDKRWSHRMNVRPPGRRA